MKLKTVMNFGYNLIDTAHIHCTIIKDEQLEIYTQEEADTSTLSELVVMCSYRYSPPFITLFWTDKQRYNFQDNWAWIHLVRCTQETSRKTHDNLIPDICKALLGFDALSGCDQTRKYPVIQKSNAGISLWQYQTKYWRR